MKQDTKVILGIILATAVVIVGGIFLLTVTLREETLGEVAGVEANPSFYDLGEVAINAGVVTREYAVKNATERSLKLKKIATSCMCTTAQVLLGEKATAFFGMEHPTDKNPPVNLELASGEAARVVVNFDPAAHGPEGLGPFERVVWLTFSDPAGIKELKLFGTVVSQ